MHCPVFLPRARSAWQLIVVIAFFHSWSLGRSCRAEGTPNARVAARFENVAAAAGLNYTHNAPNPADTDYCHPMPYMLAGAATGDFDGDGWADLYVTRFRESNLLFRNLSNGTFEEVGAARGVDLIAESSGCAVSDVNNDGHLDLYVLTISDRNYLYINDGTGHFVESAIAYGVAVPETTVLRWRTSAAFGDYDRDGDLDLHVVAWYPAGLNRLFRNDGPAGFSDVTEAAGVNMLDLWGFATGFADVNSDGWPDLLVAADFGTSKLFLNLGNGSFTDITTTANVGTDENGMGSAVGDVDNDGDLDWFVTSIFDPADVCATEECGWGTSGNRLFINDGAANFVDGTDAAGVRDGSWGWGASFLDFDNDGDLDIGMTNGVRFPCFNNIEAAFHNDPLRLWENDGTGTMTEISAGAGFVDTGSGKAFVCFDYDRDGDVDVFVANNDGPPVLLRNNSGNQNDWLRVSLRGTVTNRFGIGARIYLQVYEAGPVQMREMSANSNFMSQNELIAHFGLGPAVTSIHSLRVEWPVSGYVQWFSDVAANQLLVIEEQAAIPAVSASGLGVMILLLLIAGAVVMRRRT